ncbi:transforming growth factor beta activator LRRC33 isoform X2 [Kryptolebias marmoratus]|uniref:Negative regulator of reactive oxygen species n=2 Tax=Kryptolebias marmoratus TaxID=37003 RepID=A0A3Q3B403_KRYMA|nr:transforming growth factor beta activator LRRC33 isoform X2 [Kryptolebias marmoratus]XP_017287836.1 transforming growth factor beta activator LRRC33 isoform X2 [Kryptolebias marmoratus]
MPARGLTPLLFCLLPVWTILTPASGHPQHSPCSLEQQTAHCSNRKLSSVPVGLPGSLEELQLNYNHIKTLQDDSLLLYPSLNTLSLACSGLEKLESNVFQASRLLESLNLPNNNLNIGYQESSLALRKVPRLQVLDLSGNKLNDEMASTLLENLTSLEYLNLSGNLLMRLDETSFRDLHQLKDLDLSRNIMFEMDGAFDGNLKLRRLNLAFNYLPCLIDFHMTQLLVLNVSHNAVEWFIARQDLNETFQLETLDLSHNKLLFFPFLPKRSNLQNLYLSHNIVRFYEHFADNATFPNSSSTVEFYNLKKHVSNVSAQLWDDSLHGDISAVEILDLRYNQVDYFPRGFIGKMSSLSRLHVGTNCLKTLNFTSERFSGSLYELDISNNRLKQVLADDGALTNLDNLTYFNLSLNSLKELPYGLFSSLPKIQSVDLSYNSVNICRPEEAKVGAPSFSACVDWSNIMSLRQLYLKGCNLESIPASAFTGLSLTHLELSDNPGLVVQDSLQSLGGTLQHLGLGNTQVKDLEFSPFQSLRSLNLSRNSLLHIPSSILNIEVLEVLDLRDNELSTIPSGQADTLALTLQTVFLTGNPFDCCQTEWFKTFQTSAVNMAGQAEILCEDLFHTTHRALDSHRFLCFEGESVLWYILLLVPVCLFFVGVSIVVFLTFKPRMLQKSIKKKYLKPTSY